MAKGPSYRVPFRRRREGKTDYKARKALVASRLPRMVTRGSLRNMNVQVIEATPTGDMVIASASSAELKNYGWRATCGNIPSAYLTGLLCGKRAIAKSVRKAVADIGLGQPTKGARVFASLKGVVDAGVDVPHDVNKLPDNDRLSGQHIADYAESLASLEAAPSENVFSEYKRRKAAPEKLTEYFATTKRKILSVPKKEKPKKTVKKKGKKKRQKGSRKK